MSYRLKPSFEPATKTGPVEGAFGVHDTMRYGPKSARGEIATPHPLEVSETQWLQNQDKLRQTLWTNVYGFHAPLRVNMERALVSQTIRVPALHVGSNLHLDILNGRINDYLSELYL